MKNAFDTAACADLTAFRRDLLAAVVREGPCSGQTLRHVLEPSRADDVNAGWLYPNLDELVEMGLVTKGKTDKRTNSYEPTERGRRELLAYLDWLIDCAEGHDA